MTILESLFVSLFCIMLVFLLLSCIYAMIKLQSKVLRRIESKSTGTLIAAKDKSGTPTAKADGGPDKSGISSGEMKLIDVDEKTAAMIMSIVSHESHIPLSELAFKSIRAIEEA